MELQFAQSQWLDSKGILDVRWPPGEGEASGAGSGTRAAPGFHFKAARLSPSRAPHTPYGRLPCLAAASAQPRLTIATSRGSPAAPAAGGGGRTVCRPVTRPRAAAGRNGGPS